MVNLRRCGRCGYRVQGQCRIVSGLRVDDEDPGCKFFCSNPPHCTRCGTILQNNQVLIADDKIYCVNCGSNI